MQYVLSISNPGNVRLRLVGEIAQRNWTIDPGHALEVEIKIQSGMKPYVSQPFLHEGENRIYVGAIDDEF